MSLQLKKFMGLGAAAMLLAVAQPVAAGMDCCDPCGDWEIGAHALYQMPTNCRFTYAVSNAPSGEEIDTLHGVSHDLPYGADWGYRIFGRYLKNCSFLGVSYQWIESSATDSVIGDNVFVWGLGRNRDTLSEASAHHRFKYQNVDVRWGHYLHQSCAGSFYYFGNVRWIGYSRSRKLQLVNLLTGERGFSRERGKIEGGAIGVGVGAERDLWCNIGIFGESNLLGVIANQSLGVMVKSRDSTFSSFLSYPSNLYISPEAALRIGLDYEWACDCLHFVFEVGYEIDYFWNALATPELLNVNVVGFGSFFGTHCLNIGFSGLFFGGKFLF